MGVPVALAELSVVTAVQAKQRSSTGIEILQIPNVNPVIDRYLGSSLNGRFGLRFQPVGDSLVQRDNCDSQLTYDNENHKYRKPGIRSESQIVFFAPPMLQVCVYAEDTRYDEANHHRHLEARRNVPSAASPIVYEDAECGQ
jgi:hypothetical protein